MTTLLGVAMYSKSKEIWPHCYMHIDPCSRSNLLNHVQYSTRIMEVCTFSQKIPASQQIHGNLAVLACCWWGPNIFKGKM